MRRSNLFILIFFSSIFFCPYLTKHLRSSVHVYLSVWSNEKTAYDTDSASVVTSLPNATSHLKPDTDSASVVTSHTNGTSHTSTDTDRASVVTSRMPNHSRHNTVEWNVPVLNESTSIDDSLFSESQQPENQNKQNGRRRRSTVSKKENLEFRPSKEPIQLLDTIQLLYDQVLYFSDHSTTITFRLPFNELLHSLLTLFKFLNDMNH